MKSWLGARLTAIARRKAFTFKKLLVVVATTALLVSISGSYFIVWLNDAKIDATRTRAREISRQLEAYFADCGEYPASLEALLAINPKTGKGPYLKERELIIAPVNGEMFVYDLSGSMGTGTIIGVPFPDVYAVTPDGRIVGNFKRDILP